MLRKISRKSLETFQFSNSPELNLNLRLQPSIIKALLIIVRIFIQTSTFISKRVKSKTSNWQFKRLRKKWSRSTPRRTGCSLNPPTLFCSRTRECNKTCSPLREIFNRTNHFRGRNQTEGATFLFSSAVWSLPNSTDLKTTWSQFLKGSILATKTSRPTAKLKRSSCKGGKPTRSI